MSVWQKSFRLLNEIYIHLRSFPDYERYGLSDDLRRAVNSICHNLAEGFGRFEMKDKTRFYKISRGRTYEAISQILVAESQFYISRESCDSLISACKEIIEELNSLIFKLENYESAEISK